MINHTVFFHHRFEDLTDPEAIRQNHKCDRSVCLYGYMRGAHMKYNCKIHVIGRAIQTQKLHSSSKLTMLCFSK